MNHDALVSWNAKKSGKPGFCYDFLDVSFRFVPSSYETVHVVEPAVERVLAGSYGRLVQLS